MNIFSSLDLALCLLCAYVGFRQIVLYFSRRSSVDNLHFSLLCFAVSLNDVACIGLYNSHAVYSGELWQKAQFFCSVAISMEFVTFTYCLIKRKQDIVKRVLLALLSLLLIGGACFGSLVLDPHRPMERPMTAFGASVTYFEHKPGVLWNVLFLVQTIGMAWLYGLLIAEYVRAKKRDLLPLLIGFFAFFVSAVVDMLISINVITFLYTVEYGFLIMILAMDYVLVRRFIGLFAEVETLNLQIGAHNENLEATVSQRTAEVRQANHRLRETLVALQEKDRLLLADLAQAKMFQEKILPSLPPADHLEWATRYLPLDQVGGDIFDICQIGPNYFRVFLADAVGHGVQASMRTLVIKAEYDRLKGKYAKPAEVLKELSRRLIEFMPGGEAMCTATCFDVLSTPQGAEVRYANAAQNALLRFASGRVHEIYGDGPFLGVREATWTDWDPVQLGPGEILVAATDGLVEQRNNAGRLFEEVILSMQPANALSAGGALTDLLDRFQLFRGSCPVSDDITLVAIRIVPQTA